MMARGRKSAILAKGGIFYLLLCAVTIVYMVPVLALVFTSMRSNPDLYSRGLFAIPGKIIWKNYSDAWKTGNMSIYFKNSFLVAGIKVPLYLLISTLGGFALAKMDFRFAGVALSIVITGMLLPVHVALIPLTIILNSTKLIDTYQGLILVYLGFSVPFGIFLSRGYFRTIPKELDDAARIDGCSDFSRYWRIVIPLAVPIIATMIILDFLDTWNEMLMALLFIKSNVHRTIPIGLLAFRDRYYSNYTLMAAGILISTFPITIIYIIFQKYFISGLAAGALKG
jgi:raffinose/stachyose/melibiose transport system permease protein